MHAIEKNGRVQDQEGLVVGRISAVKMWRYVLLSYSSVRASTLYVVENRVLLLIEEHKRPDRMPLPTDNQPSASSLNDPSSWTSAFLFASSPWWFTASINLQLLYFIRTCEAGRTAFEHQSSIKPFRLLHSQSQNNHSSPPCANSRSSTSTAVTPADALSNTATSLATIQIINVSEPGLSSANGSAPTRSVNHARNKL
ncbi:hypothetical protein AC578_9292 [Pseudocercospora eumusae]|uniref:Uncharacterized protein n=1 Tax=Pseudocercospora eumusae TaxID=321146 RepID=A0A139HNI0_9PEZI|nr:hypothetical protein AC578_9292 [Pseudocercospora eumusae]